MLPLPISSKRNGAGRAYYHSSTYRVPVPLGSQKSYSKSRGQEAQPDYGYGGRLFSSDAQYRTLAISHPLSLRFQAHL
ncbi:unnamed protein product [Cuscuta campestris]|uniref:Uncharacterized protein n=1 Tax=Cuscuta campestris TaxID=132261 RepID=A0A484MM88_9ASTE|nr:unnamed protein product [Cuscuta campestris]